tara:strand:+ start:732 stop:1697 length:966 start_codon:yes stop_codon:yes gene_type:complete
MPNNINNKICLIGAGDMAFEYSKVLDSLDVPYNVIGRGRKSAQFFQNKTGHEVHIGGIDNTFNNKIIDIPNKAIVAVGIKELSETAIKLMNHGVKNILLEKPGGLNLEEIDKVLKTSQKYKVNIYIAYNRRYYASVDKARDIIDKDGGVTSFSFDFTEWSHEIEKLEIDPIIKKNWFLANSSHVVDLAFFLCGHPKKMSAYICGKLDWHPIGSVFSGSGKTENGALFSYHANWNSAGRWGVNIMTSSYRIILKPLEKIQIQKRGKIDVQFLEIDDNLDINFKPGIFKQTECFIANNTDKLCSIEEQYSLLKFYYKMISKDT